MRLCCCGFATPRQQGSKRLAAERNGYSRPYLSMREYRRLREMPSSCAARDLLPPVFSSVRRIRSHSISSKRARAAIGDCAAVGRDGGAETACALTASAVGSGTVAQADSPDRSSNLINEAAPKVNAPSIDVGELAHVARPSMTPHRVECSGVDAGYRIALPHPLVEDSNEVLREQGNVIDTIAQRRHHQNAGLQAVVKVLAQIAATHRRLGVAIGRGNESAR